MKAILNPFDTYAIEEGVLIKEKFGGEVIVLSMGPPKAEESLREAISVGASFPEDLTHGQQVMLWQKQ